MILYPIFSKFYLCTLCIYAKGSHQKKQSKKELLEMIEEGESVFEPGSKSEYSNSNYLSEILNIDNIISCMGYMIDNLKKKEIEMGYDKIWSIGESK